MTAAMRALRLRLSIHGRVQGVWFRGSTQQQAERLGVHGWVRNRPDGSVEAVLEGEPGAVRELERWCHEGPPGARVVDVVATQEPPEGEERFSLRA